MKIIIEATPKEMSELLHKMSAQPKIDTNDLAQGMSAILQRCSASYGHIPQE